MAITHAKVSPKTDVADTDLVRPSDWNAAHVGTLDHAALSAVTPDQHHGKAHAHDGADGSGTVAGANLTGTPGGELGGTWSAPTVDLLHGGSTHAAVQAAAQATAAAALAAHAAAGDPHGGYATDADLAAHTGDTSDAHDASAVSSVPAGGLAAGNVQAALNELDSEKVPTTRTLTAGAGLAGGGTLAANRTFDVNVDGSTLEISADALRVKDGGITTAKLAFNPATQAELDAHTASAVMDGDTAGGDLSGAYPNPSVVNDSHAHGSGTAPGAAHPSLATHDALGLATDAELAAHTGDTVDAHDASAISFTPAGTIAATDVQAAIEEVAAEAGTGATPTLADVLAVGNDANAGPIVNLADPSNDQDAATKAYVDANGVALPIAESDVTDLVADLASKVPRPISGTPTSPQSGTLSFPGSINTAFGPADSLGQFETFGIGVVVRVTVTADISHGVGVCNSDNSDNQFQAYNPTPIGAYDFVLTTADVYDFYSYPGGGGATGAGTWEVMSDGSPAVAGQALLAAEDGGATTRWEDVATLPIAQSAVTDLVSELAAKATLPITHSSTTDQTADDHHAQLHAAQHLNDGSDVLILPLNGVQVSASGTVSPDGVITASGGANMTFNGTAGTFLLNDGTTFHHDAHAWNPNPGSGTDRYLSVWIANNGIGDGGSTPAGAGYEMNEGRGILGGWFGYVLLAWIFVPAAATRSDQCTVIDKRTFVYAPGQAADAELAAIAGLTSAADKLPYFTGSGTAALADLSTAGRAIIDDANAAAQRTTLGLGTAAVAATGDFDAAGVAASAVSTHAGLADPHPGYLTPAEGNAAYEAAGAVSTHAGLSDPHPGYLTPAEGTATYDAIGAAAAAQAASQPVDAELTAIAGLASAANKAPYFTGSGAAALADLTAAGRALIDDADAAAQRTTLGLGTLATASSIAHADTTGKTANDHHSATETINFIIDGSGATITTGIKGDIVLHAAGTITEWEALADQSGSIVVDIWRDTYANFPPTVADTITGAEKPTISAATKGQDTSLNSGNGWAVAAGDVLRFNVDSVTSIQRVSICLKFVKT